MRPGLFGCAGGEGARKTSREPSASDDAPPSKRSAPSSPGGRRPAFNPGLLASPFYGGPTMYGGAGACNSSSPRPRYSSLFYERRKTDVKVTPAKTGGAMSQTSKRIWELLAHYSTPISDAMRAPPARPPSETSEADRSASAQSSSSAPRRLRELRVPGIAALLKLKRNNRTVGSAQAAIAASLSSSLPYEPDDYSGEPPAASKAKRDRLDLDSTPPATLTPTPTPAFRFSAPARPDLDAGEPPAKRFTFRDPFDAFDRLPRAEAEPPKPTDKPVRLWNGTDKTSDEKNKEEDIKTDTLASLLKKQRSQWECDSCMSRNDSEKVKCVCCEAPKPGTQPPKKAAPPTAPPIDSGFASLVQKQKSQWECSSCLSRNDANKNKCACCETAKPGSENSAPPTKNDSGFATLLQKQKSQWECSSCLTRNETSRNKCACCEADKPGMENSTSTIKFNFGSAPSNSFKFGVDKSDTPTEPVKSSFVLEKEDSKNKASDSTGGFAFGIAPTTVSSPKPLGDIKFGIANGTLPSDSEKTKSIIFGVPPTTDSDKTKPVTFGLPSTDADKPKIFTGIPSVPDSEKSKSITFGVVSDDKEKDPPTSQMPTFTFGSKLTEKPLPTIEPPKITEETKIAVVSPPITQVETISQLPKEKDSEVEKSKETSDKPEATKSSISLGTVTAPAATQSMFTFGSSPKNISTFGSAPQFNFGSNALTNSTSKSPESNFKPALFNFGAKANPVVSETEIVPKDSPKITFPVRDAPTSLFSAPTSVSKDVIDGLAFKPPSDEPKTVSTPSFSFTSPVSSPSTLSTSIFKSSATSPAPLFTFGGAPSKPESSNVPIFGSKSAPATNIFGSPPASDKTATIPNNNPMFKTAPTTTAPSFSSISGSVNIFGSKGPEAAVNPVNAGNLFGSAPGAESKSTPVFGAALNQNSTPQMSLFSNSGSTFSSANVFGGPQTNNNAQQPSLFNAKSGPEPATGMFGSKPPSTQPASAIFGSNASTGTGGIFGSHPAVPTPVFGASIPFGETQSAAQNVPFKFGATSSAPTPGAGFGQAPAAGSSAPVFSFGSSAGAPPPSINSQFNFSMGAPTPAFPATPGANPGMPVRRFKKAIRRNVQR